MLCRICGSECEQILDLGYQPLANRLLENQDEQEKLYPLTFHFCEKCQSAFTDSSFSSQNVFDDSYPYYSSVNKGYVEQCRNWARTFREEHPFLRNVLEIGSNDGYMLQNFKDLEHVGIEPSYGPYLASKELGLNAIHGFFGRNLDKPKRCELIIANNVLAHTPNLLDMAGGISDNLSQTGIAVIEFPTLNNLINHVQYDTIYHEHFSYFTLYGIGELFRQFDLEILKYDPISSHGGSIRVYIGHGYESRISSPLLKLSDFQEEVENSKLANLRQIIYAKEQGADICLFGAAAKGNTYLNYLGLKYDTLYACVDETPSKIGKFLPGSRIPIVDFSKILTDEPDILYILPWNFKEEIIQKTKFIYQWGGHHLWRI